MLLKAEHLQRTGSYKARGALNQLLCLREAGARAASSPPRAAITAKPSRGRPARSAGEATIVVPDTIAPVKRRRSRATAPGSRSSGRAPTSGSSAARELAVEHGLAEIPPYDHAVDDRGPGHVAARGARRRRHGGRGGRRARQRRRPRHRGPCSPREAAGWNGRIVGVEPAGADDTRRSLAAGRRVRIDGRTRSPTRCEPRARASSPSRSCAPGWPAVAVVDDAAIVAAMRLLLERAKQLVEPGGAAALAAVLAGRVAGERPRARDPVRREHRRRPTADGARDMTEPDLRPFTPARRRTAEHMLLSRATSAHAFVAVEADYERVDAGARAADRADLPAVCGRGARPRGTRHSRSSTRRSSRTASSSTPGSTSAWPSTSASGG